jgi:hypothetical protein
VFVILSSYLIVKFFLKDLPCSTFSKWLVSN